MIQIKKLRYNYANKHVFKDISISFEIGKLYGLFGANGIGKSTLLKLISGLLFCKNDEIKVFGMLPRNRDVRFTSNIYFIPEEFKLPNIDIQTLLIYYSSFYPNFDKKLFFELIKKFEIPERMAFNKMSLGQKKKAIISFGIASNTPLLLMDEPTNGLDINSKSTYNHIIRNIDLTNRCIIISTHQAKDLEGIVTDIVVLKSHQDYYLATVENLLRMYNFTYGNHNPQDAIYSEQKGDTFHSIVPFKGIKSSNVDIELFYKFITTN